MKSRPPREVARTSDPGSVSIRALMSCSSLLAWGLTQLRPLTYIPPVLPMARMSCGAPCEDAVGLQDWHRAKICPRLPCEENPCASKQLGEDHRTRCGAGPSALST